MLETSIKVCSKHSQYVHDYFHMLQISISYKSYINRIDVENTTKNEVKVECEL